MEGTPPGSSPLGLPTLPTEVVSRVTEYLSPRSIRALEESSAQLRGRVSTQPRVLSSSRENPVRLSDLRLLPNVRQVQGLVLIPYEDNEVALLSRRLVGDLEILQKKPFFVKDALSLLLVRGLLYPQSLTRILLTTSHNQELEFRYHQGFLRLFLEERESYENLPSLIQSLPITSFQMEDFSTEEDTFYEFLPKLEGNSIRELVFDEPWFGPVDSSLFPSVETLRFVGSGTLDISLIFRTSAPNVTRILGARMSVYLIRTPGGFSFPLDETTTELRNRFPSLKEGDVTFVLSPLGLAPGPLPPEALLLIQTEIQNFQGTFPGIQVKVEWIR